jgi:hypothetical protein
VVAVYKVLAWRPDLILLQLVHFAFELKFELFFGDSLSRDGSGQCATVLVQNTRCCWVRVVATGSGAQIQDILLG